MSQDHEDLEDESTVATFAVDVDSDESDAAREAAIAEFGDVESDEYVDLDRAELDSAPVVAVIGRPNVGKSTLINRMIGRREAVVEDFPGVTKDRVHYETEWNGRKFIVLDTGGWSANAKGINAHIKNQAEIAATEADLVLLIVDAHVGATDIDEAVVRMLRGAKVPVLLVANKADNSQLERDSQELWSLGVGVPFPVSALHGRSSGDLMDEVVTRLPEVGRGKLIDEGPYRVALMGRPNVGKSSLLNKLAGSSRSVVDSVAGTTVDPVDEIVEIGGEEWRFIDTAGIRKRVKQASGTEWYASLRTRGAIERAQACVVLIDASEPVGEQDVRIINMVVESGRALVLAFNKWDLVDDDRRYQLDREYDRDLAHVAWAPRVNISASTGRHVDRLAVALNAALLGWSTRVSTGRLNSFLGDVVAEHVHPVRGGKQPRILFATQPSTQPPRFVLFASGFLEASYRRFLERRLREEFGFAGSPIDLEMRIREKRRRN